MNETQTPNPFAVADAGEKAMEYIPFGNTDKIRLTVKIVQNLIAVPTRSGKTCSDRDAIKFMAMCQAKRLNPLEGDAFLIGYDNKDGMASFSLITAHQAYLKRAEIHPEFDGMKSGIIVEEDGKLVDLEGDFHTDKQKPVGGWATVFFKNRKQPMHKRVRLSRFQKPFGVWQDDPAGMICKVSEADALRSSFPTMLGGLYMREEVEFIGHTSAFVPPPQIARPVFDGAQTSEDEQAEAAAGLAPAKGEPAKAAISEEPTAPRKGRGRKPTAEAQPAPQAPAPPPPPPPVPNTSQPEHVSPGAAAGPAVPAVPLARSSSGSPVVDQIFVLLDRDKVNETEILDILKRRKLARPEWDQLVILNDDTLKEVIATWEVMAAQVRMDRKAKATAK